MQTKVRKISTLIENQLPGFITAEYENFSKFVEKYYEHLESQGNPLDVIGNITKYRDIDFYEENLLNQSTILTNSITSSASTIIVDDATSFPKKNGYIRINDEICFYKERTDTEFLEVSRGVSGNTTLGDLYEKTTFVTTQAASHEANSIVYNISNLFLYAFVKNFESQYLGAFPEKYLKGEIDKRTLIKNIKNFYKTKGTDKSIKFIFNSIVSRSANDIPEVYNPKDFTLKASVSDWVSTYSLKVKILSGTPTDLIGQQIIQSLDSTKPDILYASAFVDNVIERGEIDGEYIHEIILDPKSINGTFEIASKTQLTSQVEFSDSVGDRIDVFSTLGWRDQGRILIDNEEIYYNDRNVNQFIIERRGNPPTIHSVGTPVYNFTTVQGNGVKILVLGVLYNLTPTELAPYSQEGDLIQISNPGFETRNPIIYNSTNDQIRWKLNEQNTRPNVALNSTIQNAIADLNANVSAIYEDEQYYYICSSSFPSTQILTATTSLIPEDQKLLKLIRKEPIVTTEIYPTTSRDVGIFVDGTPAFSCKDEEFVSYGRITSINVTKKGDGYKKPPYVLINNTPNKAIAVLSGEVVERIEINTTDIFTSVPNVTITAGRNAEVRAIVTNGRITSLVIDNPGEYYSSPPTIRITDLAGKGNFAEFTAIISTNGEIVDFNKISEGKFYTQENVLVEVIEDAKGKEAFANVEIKKWVKDRYTKLLSNLDDNNGYVFESFASITSSDKSYGYGVVANPKRLRASIGDNLSSTFVEFSTKVHSPIIGYAYDGNPIYGPFGYSDPADNSSAIVRLQSGYSLKSNRVNGPDTSTYPLGTFVDDYQWNSSINSGKTVLDENNGRFCVTPEYPQGTYAYFITTNNLNVPTYPYILGSNYYSLPVDSNYNSTISQNDIPKSVRRLNTTNTEKNGDSVYAFIESVNSGFVSSVDVVDSTDSFSVGSIVEVNNSGTSGQGAAASVSSVYGKNVDSLEALQTKAVQIQTSETVYLFAGDTIIQASTGATGEIIGNVFNGNIVVLRNVSGTFNSTNPISSNTKVITVLLDKNSSFTKGATVSLTDGLNPAIATGEILESTSSQNSLKIKVNSGTFVVTSSYFLRSSDLNDTTGAEIISLSSLSENLQVNEIKNNIAIVETAEPHNLTNGDFVDITITPDDITTETTYYVRKRYYQKLKLRKQQIVATINDTGIGRADLLNSGADYQSSIYSNIELVFQNSSKARENIGLPGDTNNARATIVVSNIAGSGYGKVTSVTITDKGSGYQKGDILTVQDSSLNRLIGSISTQRLILVVDHVGVGKSNTTIKLSSVNGLSNDDVLQIGSEVVKIVSVDQTEKEITVTRGFNSTKILDHFDGKSVELIDQQYRFNIGLQFLGTGANSPYVVSYDKDTQELIVNFAYGVLSPNQISLSNTFYDSSSPQKLVKIASVEEVQYNFEFSKDNIEFETNPVIDIQKFYKYKFDTSHISMTNTYLAFSPSITKNIISVESLRNDISPGTPGSNIIIKTGYNFIDFSGEKTEPKYLNYYYFDKNDSVSTQGSYLRLIVDPLQGQKLVTYVTPTRFVYEYSLTPQYDGSGVIFYTTSSQFAIGKINTISIENPGDGYKITPLITGVRVSPVNEALIEVNYDSIEKNINSITVLSGGTNYSKPKAVVVDGDGSGAEFEIISSNGNIDRVIVKNSGKNYTYKPTVKIIESDVKLYFNSTTIGTPKSIKLVDNGAAFHSDNTQISEYKSHYAILVKNNDEDAFYPGEKVVQTRNILGSIVETASGIVSKNGWRIGGNILRLEKVTGVFDKSLPIKGKVRNRTADIVSILYTQFSPNVKTYFDNIGYYSSERGQIGVSSQKLTDSFFYQDYSYVIKSRTPIQVWRNLIKETVHPAGFKVFGEVIMDSNGINRMPAEAKPIQSITTLNLAPQNITVVDTKRQITETVVSFDNLNIERGIGSVSVDTFDNSETLVHELILSAAFDGRFDPDTGQVIGTRTFTLIDKETNLAFTPYNENHLVITLDGILQEPKKSYTISGSQITFYTAPFGPRIAEGQQVDSQRFYCRSIIFKNSALNDRYFKKLQSISSQFDGAKADFDLFYEDGSIVKTDINENLIVALNGVLQKCKRDAQTPFGNSYYIERNADPLITDKIVFSNPPIKHDDIEITDQEELAGREKSFIHSIGAYERLTINTVLSPYRGSGPYLILNEIDNTVRSIDDPKYALVFLDGVLQNDPTSYLINGPNITFSKPLNYSINENGERIYQDVSILLLYGRDLDRTLTFYDFEPDTYFNKLTFEISGTGSYNQFYYWEKNNSYKTIYTYQDNNFVAKVKGFEKVNSSTWKLFVLAQNIEYDSTKTLKFTSNPDITLGHELELLSITSVSVSQELNLDGEKVMSRNGFSRYFGTELSDKAWFEQTRSYANLLPGDKIKIDGEKTFREIRSIPHQVKSKQFNINELVTNEIYSKVSTTAYNDIARGEGLSVYAKIREGKVVELEWNRRDLELYFNEDILLQPTAYQYFTTPYLNFIPVDENGGGAKAEVIIYNGQVIDVVLVDGGYGYTKPPKVVVARGYDRIKGNDRKADSVIRVGINPYVEGGFEMSSTTSIILSGAPNSPTAIQSIITYGTSFLDTNISRKITQIILPDPLELPATTEGLRAERVSIINAGASINSIVSVSREIRTGRDALLTNISSFVSFTENKTNREIVRIIDGIINKPIVYIPYESINEVGTYLDTDMSPTDTVAYVSNTTRFPATGKLLIGKEIVSYYNKSLNRFNNLQRGLAGTVAQSHLAGDYLRTLPEFVSFASLGATTKIHTEVSVASSSETSSGITTITATTVSTIKTVSVETIEPEITISPSPILLPTDNLRISKQITQLENVGVNSIEFIAYSYNLNSYREFTNRIESITDTIDSEFIFEITKYYKTGTLDFYEEPVVLFNPIKTRTGEITLLEPTNEILLRSNDIVVVRNLNSISDGDYDSYYLINAGNNLEIFEGNAFIDTGVYSVSGITLNDIELIYPSLALRDFEERPLSAITLSGDKFNLATPSIQNPVTNSTTNGTISSSVSVTTTANFPSSGYFYHSNGSTTFGVVRYTGKTSTSFTGCTVFSGSSTISNLADIIPYSV